jgi:hypothetical protein
VPETPGLSAATHSEREHDMTQADTATGADAEPTGDGSPHADGLPHRQKPRRRRKRSTRRCIREGCIRNLQPASPHLTCSLLCAVASQQLEQAQRLCQPLGGDTEHWPAVVALNDALSAYYRSDPRIYRAAREVGITDEQWQAIKRGTGTGAGR